VEVTKVRVQVCLELVIKRGQTHFTKQMRLSPFPLFPAPC
jgi:hypothetical protein